LALVRVAHHYGGRPEFVLLGGLLPALLCSSSESRHAGTTDVDVQVDLEIARGSVDARRLERALHEFDDCDQLGAVNLRGTGYASQDTVIHKISANDHGTLRQADINVTGLAGFLLAKMAAAHGRRKAKDGYDIAFVLLNNDHGNPSAAAVRVTEVFGPWIVHAIRTQVLDLQANFADADAQGTLAYVNQITLDHPDLDKDIAAADAQLAVEAFTNDLLGGSAAR
jgi:hypothetical protein